MKYHYFTCTSFHCLGEILPETPISPIIITPYLTTTCPYLFGYEIASVESVRDGGLWSAIGATDGRQWIDVFAKGDAGGSQTISIAQTSFSCIIWRHWPIRHGFVVLPSTSPHVHIIGCEPLCLPQNCPLVPTRFTPSSLIIPHC